MDFEFTPEQVAFRQEVRDFFEKTVDRDKVIRIHREDLTDLMRDVLRKLGQKGYLSLTWPKEYGGQGKGPIDRLIFLEEMAYFGLPVGGFLTGARLVGPTLHMYGSEEQKRKFLPRIASGEIEFALGYTEPEAGSDLASLRMKAVEEEHGFRISGQKTFNTGCHRAEYHWLAARTDPEAKKHLGVSLFIVDLKSPGITLEALESMDGIRTNAVYYDNVFVPRENLIGEKNRGFHYVRTALALERSQVVGDCIRLLEELVRYAANTKRYGKLLIEQEWVRQSIGELATSVKLGRLMCYQVAWIQSQGRVPAYEASQLKVHVTELKGNLAEFAMRMLGHLGELQVGSEKTNIKEPVAWAYMRAPLDTVLGGSSEIQRNVIATRGLGLPR